MTAHPPPVPPEQQSDKAPKSGKADTDRTEQANSPVVDSNPNQSDGIKQNTRNKGYQQDR